MSLRRRNLFRKTRLLDLFRLEDRVTPAVSYTGPYNQVQLDELNKHGATTWTPFSTAPTPSAGQVADIHALRSWYFQLDTAEIKGFLEDAPKEVTPGVAAGSFLVSIPSPAGYWELFRVWEVSIMEPGLAQQFPTFHTYRGQGVDDPYATLAADMTDAGFHAQVLSPNGAYYVDPYFHLDTTTYISYYNRNNITPHDWHCLYGTGTEPTKCECGGEEGCTCPACLAAAGITLPEPPLPTPIFSPSLSSNGATLRTYRAAVAADGEYTAFFGGTVALGQAAVVTAMNRVDGVYEQQLSVRMVLDANNSSIVYTNAATDPYTNGNGGTMLSENQSNLDSVIGSGSYDIGHVFSTGGGGIAGLGVVGVGGQKAHGVTGNASPVGDSFWIDYVAHEMGHQFGGNHTFNSTTGSCAGNRNGSTAYEQGSGNTIMAYAGICGSDDLQPHSDPYFLWKSLDEISSYISSGAGAGNTQTPTGNAIPVVTSSNPFTIPAFTPFILTGSATDANGDPLTYMWEEADLGPSTTITTPDNGTSPLFRSFNPTTSPSRVFPNLTNLLANTNSVGEVMPSTNRTLNFRLTAFDNRTDGAFQFAASTITVVNTGAAFTVTSPNTAVSYQGNSVQTVTWNVAGTNAGAINAANVNIYLSTDGGLTFPTLLATVANNGSANVTMPNTPTTTARIKVQGAGNIFFDVSNANFTITAGSAMQVASTTPASGSILTGPVATVDFNFTQAVDPLTVGTGDITVNQGTVTNAQVMSAQVVRYTISGLNAEGTLNVNMPNGAVADLSANPVGPYSTSFVADVSTTGFPVPLTSVSPRGSLNYTGTTTGLINVLDSDAFTINLDAGQSIGAVVTPGATLQPSVNITGPGGTNQTATGSGVGKSALLQTVPIAVAGIYTFTVSGMASTVGTYSFQLQLNTNIETETIGGSNDTTGTAQALAGAYALGGGGTRMATRGRIVNSGAPLTAETEPNNTTTDSNDARFDFATISTNLYQLPISGNISSTSDTDYFNIGQLQIGDILTITESGSGSSRGTLADPLVQLYSTASGSTTVTENDDAGYPAFLDSLIYRFTISSTDTYYVRASKFGGTGTYQLAVYLENTGTAPTTGGSTTTETESNNTTGTANNVSTSWRQVNYRSTITGTASDSDYFRYQLAAGDVITARLDATGSLDGRLNIRNSAGTIVAAEIGASTDLGADSNVYGYRAASAGIYYVEVLPNSGSGAYTLNVDLSTSATPPLPVADADVYSFTVNANEPLAIGGKALSAGNIDLALLDNGGATVATGVAGSTNFDETITYTPLVSGTWYVRVSGADATDYIVSLSRNAAQDTEANDSFAAAQSLLNNRASGAIETNDDWYGVALTAGQTVTLTTTTPGGDAGEFVNNLDPRIELYDPSNVLVGGDDNSAGDGRNAMLTKAATQTGNYRVRVANVGGSTGEYTLAASVSADAPPQIAGTPLIDDGSAQRSRVRSVTVTFNEVVTLPANPADAFQLTRTGPGLPNGNVGLTVDTSMSTGTQTIAKLTFSGALTESTSLIDGRYTLTVLSSQVTDSIGQFLDGDANGFAGGDYVLVGDPATNKLFRLFGDADGNGLVDGVDFGAFRSAFNTNNFIFDFDGSTIVDGLDFGQFRVRFGVMI